MSNIYLLCCSPRYLPNSYPLAIFYVVTNNATRERDCEIIEVGFDRYSIDNPYNILSGRLNDILAREQSNTLILDTRDGVGYLIKLRLDFEAVEVIDQYALAAEEVMLRGRDTTLISKDLHPVQILIRATSGGNFSRINNRVTTNWQHLHPSNIAHSLGCHFEDMIDLYYSSVRVIGPGTNSSGLYRNKISTLFRKV